MSTQHASIPGHLATIPIGHGRKQGFQSKTTTTNREAFRPAFLFIAHQSGKRLHSFSSKRPHSLERRKTCTVYLFVLFYIHCILESNKGEKNEEILCLILKDFQGMILNLKKKKSNPNNVIFSCFWIQKSQARKEREALYTSLRIECHLRPLWFL